MKDDEKDKSTWTPDESQGQESQGQSQGTLEKEKEVVKAQPYVADIRQQATEVEIEWADHIE